MKMLSWREIVKIITSVMVEIVFDDISTTRTIKTKLIAVNQAKTVVSLEKFESTGFHNSD